MKSLRNKSWKISYSSNGDNTIADFYIPALSAAVQYDRKSGFFSSYILSRVARGLGTMVDNGGKMRLIMGCEFTPQDLEAIQKGYSLRDALWERLDASFTPPENFAQLKHLEILSWLIANECLDIKIAVPLKQNGLPDVEQLDSKHIFHEKVGIFTDINGDKLVFNGSNNESIGGWEKNVESFHVYCSWEGGRELDRVEEEVSRFEQLWFDISPNVRIFDIPDAVREKLLRYTPTCQPTSNSHLDFDSVPEDDFSQMLHYQKDMVGVSQAPVEQTPFITEEEKQCFRELTNIDQNAGCLDYCLKSIPISPWPHQIKILRRVGETFPTSYLIADEVGLGKTIETGLIIRYLLLTKKIERVLILSPASVQSQWQKALRENFNLHFWSYTQSSLTVDSEFLMRRSERGKQGVCGNPWNAENLILASSHLVRRTDRMEQLLAADCWDLVILDEAHHARRKSPQNRKETPNLLLKLMQRLREKTQALILLSATPMQIDVIEIFDLLNLLGLEGHWGYSDNFCYYFESLNQCSALGIKPELIDFWQLMCGDYFQKGGKPCPNLQQLLLQQDKLLAYRVQDTWHKSQKILNYKKILGNESFLNGSRQFLTTNTPLKDLMFRHTRETLRQYYKRGLLKRDIPKRIVQDNAIALEPFSEIPLYIAVSDYARHFYKLAQKDRRSCRGFLMTLYRKRLTSSFYAVRESLQRGLNCLLAKQGSFITDDDYVDVDDAGDEVISGMESLFEDVDPQEIDYLQNLLQQFENMGKDSKLSYFFQILRDELLERESVLVFTQYTDTMDYLRDNLKQLYGSQIACFSGRGGELLKGGDWSVVYKNQIVSLFREGKIKILLCTESAAEGLNLQNCGVLINYDMPWNPMRVEQRIGRIDRIGQRYDTVRIHNLYYDGTVEAKVYKKLRDRINAFSNVVGNLQPILAQTPTFIEKAAMSADPEEEDVLMSELDSTLDSPLGVEFEAMVTMDIESDLGVINQPIFPTGITPEQIENVVTRSEFLKTKGIDFEKICEKIWLLKYEGEEYEVTFYPEIFGENPCLKLLNFGEPLFTLLLSQNVGWVE
ncbi:helicase-related protein [Cylindrospermopsis raciborskii]|uniref:helicase-related protein n=1 Tax=Cylindrospermopsis raciborskii TaxID=77022 RepID=UPI00387A4B1E